MMKKGFTIAETLISLALIGVISAITIPLIVGSTNSNTKILYKTAYKNVGAIVNELINDLNLYPGGEFTTGADFCGDFFTKINTIGTVNCTPAPGFPNATTANGMRWYNINNNFDNGGSGTCPDGVRTDCVKISIDVDGVGRGVNLNSGDYKDILDVYIYQTGKLTVPAGSKEEEHLTQ